MDTPAQIFDERKEELRRSKNTWRNLFVFNIFLLIGVTFVAIGFAANMGFAIILWFGLALALPLIYSAVFFHAQHNRDREYMEEYSFKATMARSLESYRAIVKESVNAEKAEEQKKFLSFMIDSIESLHVSPRSIISKNPVKSEEEIKVGVVEKLADVFKKFIPDRL